MEGQGLNFIAFLDVYEVNDYLDHGFEVTLIEDYDPQDRYNNAVY